MLNGRKSFFNSISELSYRKSLGENADAFISEVTYNNLERIKLISLVGLAIFYLLWIWDIYKYLDGKWNISIGYQIITYFRSFLIVFLMMVTGKTLENTFKITPKQSFPMAYALTVFVNCIPTWQQKYWTSWVMTNNATVIHR